MVENIYCENCNTGPFGKFPFGFSVGYMFYIDILDLYGCAVHVSVSLLELNYCMISCDSHEKPQRELSFRGELGVAAFAPDSPCTPSKSIAFLLSSTYTNQTSHPVQLDAASLKHTIRNRN